MGAMNDVEALLSREFDQVAAAVPVPAQPPTPDAAPAAPRRWLVPLAVAAAVLLLLVGITAILGGRDTEPGPATGIPKTLPGVPFSVGRTMYVDGRAMPGRWSLGSSAHDTWLGLRITGHERGHWAWGTGRDVHAIDVAPDRMPVLSADGLVLAVPQRSRTGDRIRVIDTTSGQVLGDWHVHLGDVASGDGLTLVAVTSPEVRVIALKGERDRVWDLAGGAVHRLPRGRVVFASTPIGLVFSGPGRGYDVGTVDDSGQLRVTGKVHGDFSTISADGWSIHGSRLRPVGPDRHPERVATELLLRRVGDTHRTRLVLPAGWGAVSFAWESTGRIIADGVPVGQGKVSLDQHRLIRCVVSLRRCAVIEG